MRLRRLFLCPFLVLLASLPAAAEGVLDIVPKTSEAVGAADAPKVRLYGASKALVIGMDNYGTRWFSVNRPWPQLSMAVKDAEEVAKALTEQGFQVTLKKDLASADLETAFRDFFLVEGADPEARLLVWFAGHGHTIAGEGYLVPVDAPSPRTNDVEFRRKALSLRRFGEYMREARAKHVLALFDSCFAGTVFNVARAAPPPAITYATGLPVRQFVSSGEADQQVSDDGTFRKLFVDALRGLEPAADANKDGYITGSELGQFLFDKVTNLTNKGQTPRYGKLNALGYDRGNFVLEGRSVSTSSVAAAAASAGSTRADMAADATRVCRDVEAMSSLSILSVLERQHKGTLAAECVAARIDELKKAQIAAQGAAQPLESHTKADAGSRKKAGAPGPETLMKPNTTNLSDFDQPGDSGSPAKADGERLAKLEQQSPAKQGAQSDPALSVKPGSGQAFRDCADVCPEMVVVPAGSFSMGSPADEKVRYDSEDQLHVTIAKPFAVGKFAVTFEEWDACAADHGCGGYKPKDEGWGRGKRPVINVNWDDAKAYAAWLSKKTGKSYRLLSEAEREYVTRAGTTTPFWWGAQVSTSQANYDGNYTYATGGKGEFRKQTVAVDSFKPNPWGLYNVHGNVWEWTEDCWNDRNAGNPGNGSARTTGECSRGVVRGGSWNNDPRNLRSALRIGYISEFRLDLLGFRVGRTLTP